MKDGERGAGSPFPWAGGEKRRKGGGGSLEVGREGTGSSPSARL